MAEPRRTAAAASPGIQTRLSQLWCSGDLFLPQMTPTVTSLPGHVRPTTSSVRGNNRLSLVQLHPLLFLFSSATWLCWLLSGGQLTFNISGSNENSYSRSSLRQAASIGLSQRAVSLAAYPLRPVPKCSQQDWANCGGPILSGANSCETEVGRRKGAEVEGEGKESTGIHNFLNPPPGPNCAAVHVPRHAAELCGRVLRLRGLVL